MEFSEVVEILDRGKSTDVLTNGTFESLMISARTLERLKAHGFHTPSPVQEKAIPIGLVGRDLLVQAKSGTGKTLVFSVLAVENIDVKKRCVQKLIVAPTREIATQIRETVKKLSPTGTRIVVLVGGFSLQSDILSLQKQCPQIVIGTTGRICQLVSKKVLDLSHIDFFALDEADKLMEDSFQKDINFLISCLPPMRQVAVFSATYPRSLDLLLVTFLRDAALVRFNAEDVQLVGIKQYVITKCSPIMESLEKLLKTVQFSQALVFSDTVEKCEPICKYLNEHGFEASYVSSAMSQKERQTAVDDLRGYRVKILVSSDLTARGIDADRVNLVVNIEAASCPETYFHRIGRAARFGGQGAAVTLLENDQSVRCFTAMATKGRINVKRVKFDSLPYDLPVNANYWQSCPFFIELDKTKTVKSDENRDIDNVPSREEAEQRLFEERKESNGVQYKYDRETMLDLKKYQRSPEMNGKKTTQTEQNDIEKASGDSEKENGEKAAPEAPPPKAFSAELDELKEVLAKPKATKTKEEEGSDAGTSQAQPKPKFKFVPTRQKANKKFYMRGELLSIRNSASADEWRSFAMSKYDLKEEPFVDGTIEKTENLGSSGPSEETKKAEKPKGSKKAKKEKQKALREPYKEDKVWNDGVLRYNRQQMVGIQMGVPKEEWLPYIKSKYDTKEEPWELDQSLRCGFEERFRRIRAKEKAARQKVIEDRKNARKNQNDVVSSARTSAYVEINDASFEDYCTRIQKEFEEFKLNREKMAKEGAKQQRVGPVVPLRDPPQVWNYRVNMYKTRLEEMEREFRYELSMVSGKMAEMEVQTEDVEIGNVTVELEDVEVEASKCSEILEEPEIEVEKEQEEAEEEEEEEHVEDEELGDEEEGEEDEFDENMQNLAEQYRRNVDFNVVFESYFQSMNRFNSRRS